MYRRAGFLLFAAGWGANHFATMLIVCRVRLGLSASELGLIFGAYALGLVPGLVLAGRASDGLGRRALVVPASLLAIAASTVLMFGGHGFGVLLAGRLLYGLAMGSIMSPGSVWVQELSTAGLGPRRATLSLSAGFGLGPLISGVLVETAPFPMVTPYVAHAVAMATAVWLVRPVPETAHGAGRPREPATTPEQRREKAVATRLLLGQLPVAPWAFGLAAVGVAILPGLMRPHVGRPALYAGFLIAVALATGVLVQPLTTRLGKRGDLVGLAVGGLGTLLAAEVVALGSPALAFVAGILVGGGYGLVITTGLKSLAQRVSSEHRGTAVGVYYVLTYIGFALPFVHATVAKHLGDVRTLQITGAACLACVGVRAIVARFDP
ncbi:MAG: major facilitator superfamily 1 [Labilithrix sp.]|nr:major facilitator superfamily 1 [Labilithrix sp.]